MQKLSPLCRRETAEQRVRLKSVPSSLNMSSPSAKKETYRLRRPVVWRLSCSLVPLSCLRLPASQLRGVFGFSCGQVLPHPSPLVMVGSLAHPAHLSSPKLKQPNLVDPLPQPPGTNCSKQGLTTRETHSKVHVIRLELQIN